MICTNIRRCMMERKIRNAAKALIIKDDKMLAIKISDGKEEWYIMPGGGQDVEELLPEAVCREVAEELGLEIAVKDLAFVIEGVHGESFHRVDLVFLCEYKGKIENAILQSDTNQVGYDWLDIKTLNTAPANGLPLLSFLYTVTVPSSTTGACGSSGTAGVSGSSDTAP